MRKGGMRPIFCRNLVGKMSTLQGADEKHIINICSAHGRAYRCVCVCNLVGDDDGHDGRAATAASAQSVREHVRLPRPYESQLGRSGRERPMRPMRKRNKLVFN